MTRKRLRIENSMIFSIMAFSPVVGTLRCRLRCCVATAFPCGLAALNFATVARILSGILRRLVDAARAAEEHRLALEHRS